MKNSAVFWVESLLLLIVAAGVPGSRNLAAGSSPGQTGAFICIEPMAGITNAINLNHAGKYPGLQRVPGNGKWTASFWVRPNGF